MSTKVAVVIPVYRELNELEKISLAQCRKVLGRYPLIFVAPKGKTFSYFAAGDMVVHFPEKCFRGVRAYSDLLMMPFFYEPFRDFDYILIYQPDAFVFYDALEDFCSLGYDYIGAPWPYYAWLGSRKPKTPRVGNGGFSLRKVKSCHKLTTEVAAMPDRRAILDYFGEDAFFATCGTIKEFDFHTAPVNAAELFAMDYFPARHVKKIGGLPFGCHDWTNNGADFYIKTFRQFGYDLQPFREQLKNEDYECQLPGLLEKLATVRLTRRIEHGQSLLRYLPTNHFTATVIVRDEMTVRIIRQLFGEENFLCDGLVDCNVNDVEKIFSTLPKKQFPYLFVGAQENYKTHGRRVISFRHEYLKRCEELFHGLGR